jgi:hypothetical protein
VRNYIFGVTSEVFLKHYGRLPGTSVVIYDLLQISDCAAVLKLIDRLRAAAVQKGVTVKLKREILSTEMLGLKVGLKT